MPGTQFKLDMTITDPSLPRLDFDPIMPASGALMLVDPTHPAGPMATNFMPASGATIPNLAAKSAAALVSSTEALVNPIWRQQNSADVPIVKRTSKGGIYTKFAYAGAAHPTPIMSFLIANPTHDLYVSYWYRRDEATVPSTLSQMEKNGVDTSITGAAYRMYGGNMAVSTDGSGGNTVLGQDGFAAPNAAGFYCVSGAVSGNNMTGDPAKFWSNNGAIMFGTFGNLGGQARTSLRFYMEDLTVSGRTYAQVRALDAAEFAKQVTNVGGRYYGDVVV